MKKFLSILAIGLFLISLVKLGEWIGYERGYHKGYTVGKIMRKLLVKSNNDVNDALVDRLSKELEKSNNELELAKYLLNMDREDIKPSELAKVLHPEKVTAKEPTSKFLKNGIPIKKDKVVISLRAGMAEFDLEACNSKADEKDGLYYQLRAKSECWGKNEVAEQCTYAEGDDLKECKKEVSIAESEYWSDLYDANLGNGKSFAEEIAEEVVKVQEGVQDDN